MNKMNIKKGDTVYVLSGNDRKHTGRVLKVLPAKQAAIVEGIRMVTKATKPNAKNPQGGLPKTGKPTRVAYRKDENGKRVRYAKKSGEEIK